MRQTPLLFALLVLLATPAFAETEMGDNTTPGKRMPVGDYQCKMGSYAFRACQVVEEGGDFFLVIPDGLGHFLPLKAQLLGTDEANQLILLGKPSNAKSICSGETADLQKQCEEQPLVATLNKKGSVWQGTLAYHIVRNTYGRDGKPARDYKHGVAENIQIKPKK
jgi:hypothetical protein